GHEPRATPARTPVVDTRVGDDATLTEAARIAHALLGGLDHGAEPSFAVVVVHDARDVTDACRTARVLFALQVDLVPFSVVVFLIHDLGDPDLVVGRLAAKERLEVFADDRIR